MCRKKYPQLLKPHSTHECKLHKCSLRPLVFFLKLHGIRFLGHQYIIFSNSCAKKARRGGGLGNKARHSLHSPPVVWHEGSVRNRTGFLEERPQDTDARPQPWRCRRRSPHWPTVHQTTPAIKNKSFWFSVSESRLWSVRTFFSLAVRGTSLSASNLNWL